ncbi:hypothetical protein BJX96DRAFT_51195 [Aspergillus floccosus]
MSSPNVRIRRGRAPRDGRAKRFSCWNKKLPLSLRHSCCSPSPSVACLPSLSGLPRWPCSARRERAPLPPPPSIRRIPSGIPPSARCCTYRTLPRTSSTASLTGNDVLPSAPFRIGSSLDGPDCPSFGLRLSLVPLVLFSPLGLLLFFFFLLLFFFSSFHFLLRYPLSCSASSCSLYPCFLPCVRYQPRPHHDCRRRSEDQGQEPRRGTRR